MDIPEFVKTVATGLGAVETFRKLIPKLSDPKDREEAERALREAEIAFEVAQAKVAMELQYPICRKHWPPIIMLKKGLRDPYTEEFECPECKDIFPGPEPDPVSMEG